MTCFNHLVIVILYIMFVVVTQSGNKRRVTFLKQYGPRGYQKLKYSINKQGLTQGNYLEKHIYLGLHCYLK